MLKKVIGYAVACWLIVSIGSIPAVAFLLVNDVAGWRWAVLAFVAVGGLVVFGVRFGPYLLARALGQAIQAEVTAAVEAVEEADGSDYLRHWKSHAAAEGIDVWWLE